MTTLEVVQKIFQKVLIEHKPKNVCGPEFGHEKVTCQICVAFAHNGRKHCSANLSIACSAISCRVEFFAATYRNRGHTGKIWTRSLGHTESQGIIKTID